LIYKQKHIGKLKMSSCMSGFGTDNAVKR
jgi:hypothetical protein